MKKILSAILALALTLPALAGCASTTPQEAPSDTTSQSAGNEAETTAPTQGGELILYNSQSLEWSEVIVNKFEQQTGIKVHIVSGSTGDLTGRLEAEKANPQADVLWGGVADSYHVIPHLLAQYTTSEDEALMEQFKDKSGRWIPFDVFPNVIIYNTDMVSEADAPQGWEDLLKPQFKGKIAFTDIQKSSAAFGAMLGALFAFGNEDGKGYQYIEKFVENLDGKLVSGSIAVIKQVADGEHAVGITYEEGALRYVNGGAAMQVVYPKEGTYVSAGGVAIIENCPNRANAEKFIDFLMSKEIQTHITTIGRRSARTDVPTPEGLMDLADVPAVDYDIDWVKEHKEEFTGQWKDFIVQ